jgi:hypothetical protein
MLSESLVFDIFGFGVIWWATVNRRLRRGEMLEWEDRLWWLLAIAFVALPFFGVTSYSFVPLIREFLPNIYVYSLFLIVTTLIGSFLVLVGIKEGKGWKALGQFRKKPEVSSRQFWAMMFVGVAGGALMLWSANGIGVFANFYSVFPSGVFPFIYVTPFITQLRIGGGAIGVAGGLLFAYSSMNAVGELWSLTSDFRAYGARKHRVAS